MESLRIITEEHQNLWRIATTLDMVADEIDAGSKVETPFFTSVFDYIEQFMDRAHHAKEDEYLFRLLRERSTDAAAILDRLQPSTATARKTSRICVPNWRPRPAAARAMPPSPAPCATTPPRSRATSAARKRTPCPSPARY